MFNNHCIEILHFYGDCFPTEQQIKQRIRSLSYHLNIEQSFVYEIVIDDIHLDKIPESDICTISSTIVNKTQKIFKDTLNQYKDNQPTPLGVGSSHPTCFCYSLCMTLNRVHHYQNVTIFIEKKFQIMEDTIKQLLTIAQNMGWVNDDYKIITVPTWIYTSPFQEQ